MQCVIYSHFNDLRRKKAATEGRNISVRAVARETGLSLPTVLGMASADNAAPEGVRLSTISALCKYFGVGIAELIEYRED